MDLLIEIRLQCYPVYESRFCLIRIPINKNKNVEQRMIKHDEINRNILSCDIRDQIKESSVTNHYICLSNLAYLCVS